MTRAQNLPRSEAVGSRGGIGRSPDVIAGVVTTGLTGCDTLPVGEEILSVKTAMNSPQEVLGRIIMSLSIPGISHRFILNISDTTTFI